VSVLKQFYSIFRVKELKERIFYMRKTHSIEQASP